MPRFDLQLVQHTWTALAARPDDSREESEGRNVGPCLPKPRVVLADDSQQMRTAIAEILSGKCKVAVVGCALNGAQAIDAVRHLQPDILILDIIMPVMDGIRATRLLRKTDSRTRIIFLTAIADVSFQRAAIEAGAQAYVIKAKMSADLPRAISAVMSGATFISSENV